LREAEAQPLSPMAPCHRKHLLINMTGSGNNLLSTHVGNSVHGTLLGPNGDHSRDGVRQDFDMYSALVAPGGLIAFHDISPNPAE
jgi:hypothetical protein